MKVSSNPFALLADDTGFTSTDANQNKGKKKKEEKEVQKKVDPRELQQKATKVFKQRNELSKNEKKMRNKKKKERKLEKEKIKERVGGASKPAKPTNTGKKDAKTAAKGSPGTPPATVAPVPVKSYEQRKKEYEELRAKHVKDYLDAVKEALPGYAIQFQLDLSKLSPKDAHSVIKSLKDKPFKTIEQIMQSKYFLDNFKESLPEQLKTQRIPAIGRIDIKSVFLPDFPLHLAALLTGKTMDGKQKTPDEAYVSVDEYLEGLFGVKISSAKEEEKDEDDDVEFGVGSAGGLHQYLTLSDFIDKQIIGKEENENEEKEKEEIEAKTIEETLTDSKSTEEGTSSTQSDDKGSSKPKGEPTDPTTWLPEAVHKTFSDAKLGILAQRIPRGWRIARVRTPVFPTALPEKGSHSRGGRGRGRGGGRGRGDGKISTDTETPIPGFMYAGNGLDHCYVCWKDNKMIFLFTTGIPTPDKATDKVKVAETTAEKTVD